MSSTITFKPRIQTQRSIEKMVDSPIELEAHPKRNTVYLCGPIQGLSYGEARHGWRDEIVDHLRSDIVALSPMRGKDYLKDETNLSSAPHMYKGHVTSNAKAIMARDLSDIKHADLMVANFLGSKMVSIGSMVEFGFAYAFGVPVVLIIDDDNVHSHAFVHEIASYYASDIKEAARIVNWFLSAGV